MTYYYCSELYHHGVKGQKWGVRRTKAQLERARGRVKNLETKLKDKYGVKVSSTGKTTSAKPAEKSVKDMTDKQLQKAYNRKKLENDYAALSPKQVSFGQRVVNDMLIPGLMEGGKQAISNAITAVGKQTVNSMLSKTSDKSSNKK